MFTGIIVQKGKIEEIKSLGGKVYFAIAALNFLRGAKIGDSVACDGVCLTLVKIAKDEFEVELMPETLRLTKFQDAAAGDSVNLERSLRIGARLDGHFVSGHIDGVGIIKEIAKDGDYTDLIINAPAPLMKYFARKGSAAVNGVSLTIAGIGKDWFKVCLITHTLAATNLSALRIGDKVNLEVDMIARYLEQLLKGKNYGK